jgi:hypothetical protein
MEDHPAVTASQRTQHQEDMEDTLAALPAAPPLAVAADDQGPAGVNVAKENLIRTEDIVLKETLERIHMKMVKLQRKLGVMCAPLIQNDPRYVGSDKPWTKIKWPKNAYESILCYPTREGTTSEYNNYNSSSRWKKNMHNYRI